MKKNIPSIEKKLYVPINNQRLAEYKDEYIKYCRECGVTNIFITIGQPVTSADHTAMLELLKTNIKALEDEGFTVGVWMNGFGFGGPMTDDEKKRTARFTKITSIDGTTWEKAFCPLFGHYRIYVKKLVTDLVFVGAKMIMVDDDLCLNVRPGLGCACRHHMEALSMVLGEKVEREDLAKLIYTGGPNRYRSAWLKVQGDSIKDFCRILREEINTVDSSVRLGFCAGFTSWDLEGCDALELTEILAGNTKPFLRYSSAPYWTYENRFPWETPSHVVEFARLQRHWCDGKDIELFLEADSYPRPRYRVPAFAIESFDFMMAADSKASALKYIFDYVSSPDMEKGYLNEHIKNKALRESVANAMGDMGSDGIYVHEEMRKFENMTMPDKFAGDQAVMASTSFSFSSAMLSACGIPTTYENNKKITAAFGDAGRTVPMGQAGYILDYTAALEMKWRGIDVGLLSAKEIDTPSYEFFEKHGDKVNIFGAPAKMYQATLEPTAVVESYFTINGTTPTQVPMSYRYTNADGVSFLVFLFRAECLNCNSGIACSYYRREQISDFCEDLGCKLPAVIKNAPSLYIIAKSEGKKTAISFVNYSDDAIDSPVFELDKKYKKISFFGCDGKLRGDKAELEPIAARSFGAFVVEG